MCKAYGACVTVAIIRNSLWELQVEFFIAKTLQLSEVAIMRNRKVVNKPLYIDSVNVAIIRSPEWELKNVQTFCDTSNCLK